MQEFFLTQVIFSNPIITWLFFIIAYAILGGGIKYIDDAFDEKRFKLKYAILLAPILGILWAYSMMLSAASATILGAIVIAVFLKGKIDNIAHQIGIISIFVVLFVFGFLNFLWIPLIILVIAGLLDELGNDYVDKNRDIRKPIRLFFEFRFVMKLAVLFLALVGVFELFYFFAFLAFDIAYAWVTIYSEELGKKKKFTHHGNGNGNGFLEKVFFNEKRRSPKSSRRFASP
jgi:hypothetical protein